MEIPNQQIEMQEMQQMENQTAQMNIQQMEQQRHEMQMQQNHEMQMENTEMEVQNQEIHNQEIQMEQQNHQIEMQNQNQQMDLQNQNQQMEMQVQSQGLEMQGQEMQMQGQEMQVLQQQDQQQMQNHQDMQDQEMQDHQDMQSMALNKFMNPMEVYAHNQQQNPSGEKNYDDILALLKYGVDLRVISQVKNTSLQQLLNFMSEKNLPIPPQYISVPQIQQGDNPLQNYQMIQKPMQSISRMGDGKKKRKHPWKKTDFPQTKQAGMTYFCGDCKKPNRTYHCDCKRKCWKWCEECKGYRSNHHTHFKTNPPKKRRKPWTESDFPQEKIGDYYCADCKKVNHKRLCACGRDCWRWCDACNQYKSKHHFNVEPHGEVHHHTIDHSLEPKKKRRKIEQEMGEVQNPQQMYQQQEGMNVQQMEERMVQNVVPVPMEEGVVPVGIDQINQMEGVPMPPVHEIPQVHEVNEQMREGVQVQGVQDLNNVQTGLNNVQQESQMSQVQVHEVHEEGMGAVSMNNVEVTGQQEQMMQQEQ